MVTKVTVKVEGLKELGARMEQLSKDVALKIGRAATSAGAKVIKDQAISNAPDSEEPHVVDHMLVQPGNLKKNIVVKRITKSELTSEHIVTVRGKRKDGYAARYGRLVEFGTVKMAPRSYLRAAMLARQQDAFEKIKTTLAKRITKAERTK